MQGLNFADHLVFEILLISWGFNYADDQYVRPLKVLQIEHLKRNVYVGVGLKEMKVIYTNIYDDKSEIYAFNLYHTANNDRFPRN